MLLRFADQDMLMCYHWGLGVGHVYATSTPESSIADVSEATALRQSEPETVVPSCCEAKDDSNGNHSMGHSSLGDLDNSDSDNDSVEAAAMLDWQDEDGAEYEF